MHPRAADVLQFWFGPDPLGAPLANQPVWFKKDPAFDASLRQRFGEDLQAAARGDYEGWTAGEEAPEGTLALIILLDQFSRNIHRDTPGAFAQDALALGHCLAGQVAGHDAALSVVQRWFFYMPMMHAEDLAMQERCVLTFIHLRGEVPPEDTVLGPMLDTVVQYAEAHREVIAKYGRFPHRNAILGRDSTPEEQAYLDTPGSGF